MQAEFVQHLALSNHTGMVGLKADNGRTARRGKADHQAEVVTPCEVILPKVATRMEEGDDLSCSRVGSGSNILLPLIATAAGEGEVAQFVCSAKMAGLDMVYRKSP